MSTRARTSSANYFTGLAEWKAVNGHSHSAKSLPRDCTTYRMGEEEVSSSHYQETDHKNRNPPDRLVIRGGNWYFNPKFGVNHRRNNSIHRTHPASDVLSAFNLHTWTLSINVARESRNISKRWLVLIKWIFRWHSRFTHLLLDLHLLRSWIYCRLITNYVRRRVPSRLELAQWSVVRIVICVFVCWSVWQGEVRPLLMLADWRLWTDAD